MTENEIRNITNIVRDEMRSAFDEQNEMFERLLTQVEQQVERLEALEYRVFGKQPLPKMTTARLDH